MCYVPSRSNPVFAKDKKNPNCLIEIGQREKITLTSSRVTDISEEKIHKLPNNGARTNVLIFSWYDTLIANAISDFDKKHTKRCYINLKNSMTNSCYVKQLLYNLYIDYNEPGACVHRLRTKG